MATSTKNKVLAFDLCSSLLTNSMRRSMSNTLTWMPYRRHTHLLGLPKSVFFFLPFILVEISVFVCLLFLVTAQFKWITFVHTAFSSFPVTLFTRQQIGLEHIFIYCDSESSARSLVVWLRYFLLSVVLHGHNIFFSFKDFPIWNKHRLEMEIVLANRYTSMVLKNLFAFWSFGRWPSDASTNFPLKYYTNSRKRTKSQKIQQQPNL